jgi:uncharacterized membrane protein YkoI
LTIATSFRDTTARGRGARLNRSPVRPMASAFPNIPGDFPLIRNRILVPFVAALSFTSASPAAEFPRGARPFEDCLGTAMAARPGRVVKVEFKTVGDRKAYEFDIQGNDAVSWDVECNADTAELVSIEHEVDSASDPLFSSKAGIDEAQARRIVSEQYPGTIEEIEYEVEEDGAASYEFDVDANDGTQTKIEVDAATGKIIEVDREIWQVGFE